MFDFIFYLLDKLKTVEVAPETPVEVWIVNSYKTTFKCHIKSQTWGESEFKDMSVEPGEYGVGNPVMVVINAINDQKITGHAIDRQEFLRIYGNLPTLNNDQAAAARDEHYEMMQKAVEELNATVDRIMNM